MTTRERTNAFYTKRGRKPAARAVAFTPSATVRARYQRLLKSLVAAMNADVKKALAGLKGAGLKEIGEKLGELYRKYVDLTKEKCARLASWFTSQVDGSARAQLKRLTEKYGNALTVRPELSANVKRALRDTTRQNVALIRSIPDEYFGRLTRAVDKATEGGGQDQASLYDKIVEIMKENGEVNLRRAEFIARDQSSKATGFISRQRSLELGIRQGRWIHSNAAREPRQSHLSAGRIRMAFDLEKGAFLDGAWTWPGHEPNCGCNYAPVIVIDGEVFS